MAELRVPQYYDDLRLEFRHLWRILVREDIDDEMTPVDLTDYTDVKLALYADPADALAIMVVDGTVLTDAGDLYESVEARVLFDFKPLDANFTAGTVYQAVVFGVSASGNEILEKPWEVTARAGPPTSTS